MEKTSLVNNKNVNIAVVVLLIVLSLFVFVKFVNEVKANKYVGQGSYYPNTISVGGSGEVLAVSDIASLQVNLSKDAKTAKEAQDLLNEIITKTVDYLKEQNIEDKDIKSEYSGLNPKYEYERCYTYPCPSSPKIVGYTASQSINIKVREVDNSNTIKTGLAELGVTDITGPTFSIDDEEEFKVKAREGAIKDARAKAEILARDLGVKLGKIISFSEGGDSDYLRLEKSMMGAGDMALSSQPAPELPKGENKIVSNVVITYEIK